MDVSHALSPGACLKRVLLLIQLFTVAVIVALIAVARGGHPQDSEPGYVLCRCKHGNRTSFM